MSNDLNSKQYAHNIAHNRNVVDLAECSIWSVLREKVNRSKIADVDELKTRLIDE